MGMLAQSLSWGVCIVFFINIRNGMSIYFSLDREPAESCLCHVWHCWSLIKCTVIVLSKVKCSSGKDLPLGSSFSSWANRSTAALTAAFQPQPREQQTGPAPRGQPLSLPGGVSTLPSSEERTFKPVFTFFMVKYPEN